MNRMKAICLGFEISILPPERHAPSCAMHDTTHREQGRLPELRTRMAKDNSSWSSFWNLKIEMRTWRTLKTDLHSRPRKPSVKHSRSLL